MGSKQHNAILDLLRFFFSLCIIGLHMGGYESESLRMFFGAYILVDVFFVLSGIFAMESLHRAEEHTSTENSVLLKNLWKNKMVRLYPLYFCAFVAVFLEIQIFELHHTTLTIIRDYLSAFGEAICVSIWGIGINPSTGAFLYNLPGWYVSGLIFGLLICWGMALTFRQCFSMISFCVSLAGYGYLYLTYNHLQIWQINTQLAPFIRCIADLLLGCVTYYAVIKIKSLDYTKLGRLIIILIELILGAFLLCYVIFSPGFILSDYAIPFIAASFFALMISNAGLCSLPWTGANKLAMSLGKMSYPMYLFHYCVILVQRRCFPSGNWGSRYIWVAGITLLVSVLLTWASDLIGRKMQSFLPKIKAQLVK